MLPHSSNERVGMGGSIVSDNRGDPGGRRAPWLKSTHVPEYQPLILQICFVFMHSHSFIYVSIFDAPPSSNECDGMGCPIRFESRGGRK